MYSTERETNADQRADEGRPLKLVVLDTSYTLEALRERKLEASVTCRDLDGFFDHVWSVHPFASLLTSPEWSPKYGRPVVNRLTPRHDFIEGKVGRFEWLRSVAVVNFFFAQAELLFVLRHLIARQEVQVIRAGDPHYLGLFGLILSRLCGIPLVVRIGANYDLNRATSGQPIHPRLLRSTRLEKLIERFVLRRADLVAGANQDNLDYALANGARSANSTLFRYGNLIDSRHFVAPADRPADPVLFRELGVSPGKYLLTVARLEVTNSLKHHDDVVRVLAWLRARGHDVKAIFAGEGRMRSALVELAESLDVKDELLLPGNLNQEQLSQLLPHAAAFVSPHAGRALSEAALGAAPAVGYDIDWQREMIEDDVTGILVPHRAWEQMAAGAERFLSDPVYARKMGDALRARAVTMLDPETLNGHERAEYRKLVAPQSPSHSNRNRR